MLKNQEKLDLSMRWKAWLQGNCKGGNDAIPILKDINYASDFTAGGVFVLMWRCCKAHEFQICKLRTKDLQFS